MYFEDNYIAHLPNALHIVSSWEIPEEDFARAVNDQARLMAGMDLEPRHDIPEELPFASLRF